MSSDKRGSAAGVGFIILLLILLAIGMYVLYLNWPGESEEFIPLEGNRVSNEGNVNIVYEASEQFYENMRFQNSKISYAIAEECGAEKTSEVQEALEILESKTVLEFYQESSGALLQIMILCSEVGPAPEEKGYFIAGEGGPTEVIRTGLYSVIFKGEISLFREEKCDSPHIAVHEILHVLGFDHNNNPDSILYPTLNCNQEIDEAILDNINELYSVKSAADLKIVNLTATKHKGCRLSDCLDFNISVINQGLQNAEGVSLSLYADGELVKDFDLDSIEIGTTKFLNVGSLKIPRSSEEIRFVIDKNDIIDEIFEDNEKTLVLKEE